MNQPEIVMETEETAMETTAKNQVNILPDSSPSFQKLFLFVWLNGTTVGVNLNLLVKIRNM